MRILKLIVFLCLIGGLYYGWNGGTATIPAVPAFSSVKEAVSFRSYVQSKLNKKTWVPLTQVPLVFQQALIAVEDNRFYQHVGIDVEAVFRAILVNIQSGELKEGGSTITQQLVKNLLLSHDRTWSRKALEIPLTLLTENQFSKEEILEMYVNTIYYGSGANGIGEAAKVYFAKPPQLLNLPEAAMIAGLPAAPSLYSPLVDLNMAMQRQKIVLASMTRYGFIGPQQAEEARKTPLKFAQ